MQTCALEQVHGEARVWHGATRQSTIKDPSKTEEPVRIGLTPIRRGGRRFLSKKSSPIRHIAYYLAPCSGVHGGLFDQVVLLVADDHGSKSCRKLTKLA